MKNQSDAIIEQDAQDVIRILGKRIEKLSGKTIAITGANGVVGSYLVQVLHAFNNRTALRPSRIIAITHHPVTPDSRLGHLLRERDISFISGDVTQALRLPFRPDYIIHSASYASPKLYLVKPIETMEANSIGTKEMLELAKRSQSRNMLFISSGAVYGEGKSGEPPMGEDHPGYASPLDPRAVYSESKRFGETLCVVYASIFGVHTTIARLSNMYGPGFHLDDGRAIPDFFQQAFTKGFIEINGNPDARRAYLYIVDAIAAMFTILVDGKSGEAYNVSSDKPRTIREIAKLVCKLFSTCRVEVKKERSKSYVLSSPKETIITSKKLHDTMGWRPSVPFEEGLGRLYKWYRYISKIQNV